jgi:hypothetical protein
MEREIYFVVVVLQCGTDGEGDEQTMREASNRLIHPIMQSAGPTSPCNRLSLDQLNPRPTVHLIFSMQNPSPIPTCLFTLSFDTSPKNDVNKNWRDKQGYVGVLYLVTSIGLPVGE